MKVAVLLSGGVDSSVALCLLKEAGYDVTAFYLKIWLEDELAFLGECPWEEDLGYAQSICKQFDVPLEIMNMQKEYWDRVVSYTISEVKEGRTPNPDILCNQQIKFGAFYDQIDDSFEKVATGHYANVVEKDGIFYLKTTPDPIKDQTYFLGYISQKQLSRAMFPIGNYDKKEVRDLAEKYDLPNKKRKDSQGICFLGKIKFREFIEHHLGFRNGNIVEYETGDKVGEHGGFWYYTIGQRHGLGLSGGPWYVVDKDMKTNTVYISHTYDFEDKARDELEVGQLNWISGSVPNEKELQVKLRHGPGFYGCSVEYEKDTVKVKLDEHDQGIAAGQFAVFYRRSDEVPRSGTKADKEDYCLGGGVIL